MDGIKHRKSFPFETFQETPFPLLVAKRQKNIGKIFKEDGCVRWGR
jgi:hypothetical protein